MAEAFFTVDLRQKGVLLVRGRFAFPREEPLFAELAARAEAWLRGALFAHACRVYAEDTDPKKRFFFARFEYSFSIHAKTDGFVLSVTLAREGRALAQHEETLVLRDGTLAPPARRMKRQIGAKSAE